MSDLSIRTCEVCRLGAPLATDEEIKEFMSQLPYWEIIIVDEVKHLKKTFKFKNFMEALQFTNKVGELAEKEGHHPEILTQWGKVTVTWWTHKIMGLHANDFIMAAKTDKIFMDSSES